MTRTRGPLPLAVLLLAQVGGGMAAAASSSSAAGVQAQAGSPAADDEGGGALPTDDATAAAPDDDSEEGGDDDEDDARTTVVEGAPPRVDAARSQARLTATGPSPEEAVLELGGVALVRTGGPLAPVRLDVRGLSGPRVQVDLEGLPLTSPAGGDVDLASLPFFGIQALELGPAGAAGGLAGQLRLEPRQPWWPSAAVRVLGGTLSTLRADLAAGAPLERGDLLLAASAARTDGDFVFSPVGPRGGVREDEKRRNNDQLRTSALARARLRLLGLDAEATAVGLFHEGGIPGFAAAPTDGVRGRRGLVGGRASVTDRAPLFGGQVWGRLSVDGRFDHRATRSRITDWDGVSSSTLRAGAEASMRDVLLQGLALSADVGVARSALVDAPFRRAELRAGASARYAPFGGLLEAEAALQGSWLSDVGPLWGGHLSASGGPSWARGGARLVRAMRAPTLDELWAPQGLVLGNPDLRPEGVTEGELFWQSRLGRALQLRAAFFAGYLEEAILLLNRNAYEIAPANTGGLWRAGVEGSVELSPHPLVGWRVAGRGLWSRLDATGAPMPVSPPIVARSVLRLGRVDGVSTSLVVRHRSSSTSNLFGTLQVDGYALADLVAVWPVTRRLKLSAVVANVFDVRTARDLNGLPLPGRQAYLALESSL